MAHCCGCNVSLPELLMNRVVQEELLDGLPAEDPRAIRSRLDLRRVNWIMANDRIVARELGGAYSSRPPSHIVDLGAGDGHFWASLTRHLPRAWAATSRVTLVDRMPETPDGADAALRASGWRVERVCADAMDWRPRQVVPDTALVMNLFLHHFTTEQIGALLLDWSHRAGTIVACEPRRSRMALAAARLIGWIGCNDVTRHDAVVSVRAGFSHSEIRQHWPVASRWTLRENRAGLFSHLFVARRNEAT
jgi:hypothetical protein